MRPRRRRHPLVAIPLAAALALLLSCGRAPSGVRVAVEPATVEHPGGLDVARLTLTARAAERLDIRTATVQADGKRLVVPSAAVLVDPDGVFWVYTNPEPLVFVRREIGVDHEKRGLAFLSHGPPAGTAVVTVGVAELYGTEHEVGH